MKWPTSKLGYTAAGMTVLAAVLVPFLLMGLFTKGFTKLGLHVDEMYSGGPTVRTIQEDGYTVTIHKAVYPHLLQTEKPFVQLDWKPINALPQHVSDAVDIDGNGQPDVRVSFDVPKDPKMPLRVDVEALNPGYQAMRNVGKRKFSELIVRVDDAILVRVPLTGR
ncbi:MAG TPA: hypothetical protein VJY15_14235 [Candidatus Acidoferrum sp.]|nr:hypothetical protein [Candidatus Acidoferrum sp.]